MSPSRANFGLQRVDGRNGPFPFEVSGKGPGNEGSASHRIGSDVRGRRLWRRPGAGRL